MGEKKALQEFLASCALVNLYSSKSREKVADTVPILFSNKRVVMGAVEAVVVAVVLKSQVPSAVHSINSSNLAAMGRFSDCSFSLYICQ